MSWFSRAVSTVTKPLRNAGVALDKAVGGAAGWGKAVGFVAPIQAIGVGLAANKVGATAFGGAAIGAAVTSAKIGASVGSVIGGSSALSAAASKVTTKSAPAAPPFAPAVTGGGQLLDAGPAKLAPAVTGAGQALPPDPEARPGVPPLVWAALAAVVALVVVNRS